MPKFETDTKTIENAPQVTVETGQVEKELVQGLEVGQGKTKEYRQGYEIKPSICTWCGEETLVVTSTPKCPRCGNTSFRQVEKAISPSKTAEILNRQVTHKCPKCGKVYDRPTKCCIANDLIYQPKQVENGYRCPKCGSVYQRRHACCVPAQKMQQGVFIRKGTVLRRELNGIRVLGV